MLVFRSTPTLSQNADSIRKRMLDLMSHPTDELKFYRQHAQVMGVNFHAFYLEKKYSSLIPAKGPDLTQEQQDEIILKMFQLLEEEWEQKNSAQPVSARP
jgi:hypothetical protein